MSEPEKPLYLLFLAVLAAQFLADLAVMPLLFSPSSVRSPAGSLCHAVAVDFKWHRANAVKPLLSRDESDSLPLRGLLRFPIMLTDGFVTRTDCCT